MQVSTLFVLFALVAAAFGQAVFDVTYNSLNVVVGTKSDWFFITAPVALDHDVTVSITESTGNVELETPSLAFSSTVQQLSFRFTPKVVGSFVIEFSVDPNTDFITSSITINSQVRPIALDTIFPTELSADLLTEPIKLYVKNSYGSPISLTPSLTSFPDGDAVPVSIVPSTITIPPNSLSASFVVKASTPYSGLVQLQWGTIDGDGDNYYAIADSTFFLTVDNRTQPVSPMFSTNAIVGAESTLLYFYTYGDRPNDTLTITPQAADTTFSPSAITLDSNTQVAQFTVTTTSTEGTKPIYFYTSNTASNYFEKIDSSYITVNKRFLTIDTPTAFAVTKPSTLSIKIEYPVLQDLTVQFYAANLIFEPTSITFSGATTAADVKITPIYLGADTISFQVTGSDAPYYTTPSDISVSIGGGSIIATANWCTPIGTAPCTPTLWVGKESEKFAVRLNFPPATGLLVTPMAPDMIFNPTNLSFTPDSVEQWFTMTPVLAGTNNARARTVSVSFAVSGDDWAWFGAPSGTTTFTVLQRTLQTAWSSQLTKGLSSSASQVNETTGLYSGTDYTVWVTAAYVGSSDSFTVTPVSNYFKFNPQTLTFNSGSTRVSFTATPIAAIASATINYIVSGDSAGYYTSIPAETWSILLRPLYFYSAVLGRDDRVDAWRYVNATNYGGLTAGHLNIPYALSKNHVNSFSIATPAFPSSKVTITPKSAHISFSPSSVTLTPSSSTTVWVESAVSLPGTITYTDEGGWEPTYLAIANFTVNGAAPGMHEVWFDISSDDANYYAPPPHVWVTVRKYSGPGSASSTVVASIGMIVASVVLALFL